MSDEEKQASDSDEYNSAPDSSDDESTPPVKSAPSDDDNESPSDEPSDDDDGDGGDDDDDDDSDSDKKSKKKPTKSKKSSSSSSNKKKKSSSSSSSSSKSSSKSSKPDATPPPSSTAKPVEPGLAVGRSRPEGGDDDDDHSEGWSDDENPKKLKISKRQYKKDRKDELGRIFDRGNFRDEVCGTIDVTLVQGRDLVLNKKTGKSPSGRGLYVKCVVSFPKSDPLTSDLGITDEDGLVTWQFLFPSMLVHQKSGNVANAFFKYPRLLLKVRQKGAVLSKTISRGELPLGPVIAPKPETGEDDEDPLKPNADGECVVPMLNTARVRSGEIVLRVKYRKGVQQRRPI